MREIVIDTETTGLNFKSGDRIIEVGCVELKNHIPTGNTIQFYCNPNRDISEEAKSIIRGIERRQKNLLLIARFLVLKQKKYLDGKGELLPINLSDIAK